MNLTHALYVVIALFSFQVGGCYDPFLGGETREDEERRACQPHAPETIACIELVPHRPRLHCELLFSQLKDS